MSKACFVLKRIEIQQNESKDRVVIATKYFTGKFVVLPYSIVHLFSYKSENASHAKNDTITITKQKRATESVPWWPIQEVPRGRTWSIGADLMNSLQCLGIISAKTTASAPFFNAACTTLYRSACYYRFLSVQNPTTPHFSQSVESKTTLTKEKERRTPVCVIIVLCVIRKKQINQDERSLQGLRERFAQG